MSLFDRRLLSTIVGMLGAVGSRARGAGDGGSGARARGARSALLVAVAAVVACSLSGVAAGAALGASCPNAQFRTGTAANLPDCRAYEQVSPVDKDGFDVATGSGGGPAPLAPMIAAASGDEASFYSLGSFAGNPAAAFMNQYLSARGPSGWTTQGISPAKQAPFNGIDTHTAYVGFSPDLSRMVAVDWVEPGVYGLLLRNPDGSFTPVADAPSGSPAPVFDSASADFSHILVNQNSGGDHLFEWAQGQLTQISGSDGTPVLGDAGRSSGPFGQSWGRAISDDGSKVFWTPVGGQATVYLYENGTDTSIAASQCTTGNTGGSGPGGNCAAPGTSNGTFVTSTADGSAALLTSSQELTNDATTGTAHQGSDLYSYDTGSGTLTDLTPDTTDANGADVQGVLAASDDDSYIYFAACGVLAGGATAGTCASSRATTATVNLYVLHAGTIAFIAQVTEGDANDWLAPTLGLDQSVRVQLAADGQHLLFQSASSPTAYNSGGVAESYLYDAAAGQLHCVSCSPAGAAAVTGDDLGQRANGPQDGGTVYSNVSADGSRVFFESADPLLAQDSNGLLNVYEWEADGSGSCQSAADSGGCLYSVSSGSSDSPAFFQNATPSGNDVFFVTREQLVGQDDDSNTDVYDARVGGGLASQEAPPAASACSGSDSCQGAAGSQPPVATAASISFSGPGNATATPTPTRTLAPTPKVRILSRVVHGTTFFVRVRVPGKGRVTITGRGIARVSRLVGRAGTYRLRVRLTANERRKLKPTHGSKRKRTVKLRLDARFAPPARSASSSAFSVSVTLGGAR